MNRSSAAHVGVDLTPKGTASGGPIAYVLLTAAERERQGEKRATAYPPPVRKRPPLWLSEAGDIEWLEMEE